MRNGRRSTMTRHLTTKGTMIALGAYRRQSDAELAQMLLWAAGIPYEIEADRVVRLLVDEPDARDARMVLAAA
jgi:hypothetical protein